MNPFKFLAYVNLIFSFFKITFKIKPEKFDKLKINQRHKYVFYFALMKVLILLLLGLVKYLKSEGNIASAERRLFLENYFWNADTEKNGTIENLFKIDFFIESKGKDPSGMFHDISTNFYLEFTKMRYAMIPNWMKKDFVCFLKGFKEYKFFLRFHYSNLDEPLTGYLCVDDIKRAKKVNDNSLAQDRKPYYVSLKFDKMETCMFNIRKILKDLIRMKVFNLTEMLGDHNPQTFPLETITNIMTFDLNYFENYSKCYLSLRKFIKKFIYLKLINYNKSENNYGLSSLKSKTNLKISDFIDRLTKKINEREELDSEEYRVSLRMFTWCCECIKNELLRKNILFLIGDQYTIDFYLNEIFHIVNKFVSEHLRRFAHVNFEEEEYANPYMNECLDFSISSIQFKAIKDFFKSLNVQKYFSELLGREIKTLEDFKLVEKIMCDYHNTFACIANLYEKMEISSSNFFNYCKPSTVSFDGFKYKVVDGLVIKLLSDTSKLKEIKAFDNRGIEVILKEGTDYFKNEWGNYHIISKVLLAKKIHEIEAITSLNLNEVFIVKDYLDTKLNN